MNHGIVAYEPSHDQVGAGLWDFAKHLGERPCVAGPRIFEELGWLNAESRSISAIWRSALVRSMGEIRLKHCGGVEEYGRYEPDHKDRFCQMCRSCVWGPMRWAIVAPTATPDALFVGMLESFISHDPGLERRFSIGRPVRPLASSLKVGSDWVLLLGFYSHDPFTIFLCNEEATTERYRSSVLEASGYIELEFW